MSKISDVDTSPSSSTSLTSHLKAITIQPNLSFNSTSQSYNSRHDAIIPSNHSNQNKHKIDSHKQVRSKQKPSNSQIPLQIHKPKIGIKPLIKVTDVSGAKLTTRNPFTPFHRPKVEFPNQQYKKNLLTNNIPAYHIMESSINSLVNYFRKRSPKATLIFRHSPIMSPAIKDQQDHKYIQLNNDYLTQICNSKGLQVWNNSLPDNPFLLATDNIHVTPLGATQQLLQLQQQLSQQFGSHFQIRTNYNIGFDYFQDLKIFQGCQPSVSPLSILSDAFTFQNFKASQPNQQAPKTIYIGDSQLRPYVPPSVMAHFHPKFEAQVLSIPNCALNQNIITVLDPILSAHNTIYSEAIIVIIQIGLPNLSLLKREDYRLRNKEENKVKNNVYLKLYEPK